MIIRSLAVFIVAFTVALSSVALAKEFSYRRQVVKQVRIEGNRNISDGRLKNQLLTKANHWYNIFRKRRLSRANVNLDEKQLERFYGREGFLSATIEASVDSYEKDSSMAVVTFSVNEGRQVFLEGVTFSGGLPRLNAELGKFTAKMKLGESVNHDAVLATGFRIRDHYADNGYPFVSVLPQYTFPYGSLPPEAGSAERDRTVVEYAIAESSFVLCGDIEVVQEGNASTNDKVYKRELVVKSGDHYSRSLNLESQQRLYSTGLVKFVNIKRDGEPRHVSADTTIADMRVVISSRKPNFVNFRIGVGQDEDFNSVLKTSLSWGNRSLWGTGRKLILTVGNSSQLRRAGAEQERALTIRDLFSDLQISPVKNSIDINYVEPWFLGHRMPLSLEGIYEPWNKNPIIDKHYDRLSGEAALFKELDRFTNLKTSARVEFENIHGVGSEQEQDFRLEGDNSIRRRLSLYGQRDTRDNLFVPQRGSYSYISVDYVGHLLGGDFHYFRTEFSWSRYRIFVGENLLATRLRIGNLVELGPEGRSTSEDRFTLGGAKTVRGFAENQLGPKWTVAENPSLAGLPKGGKLMLLANVEIRRPLFWRFGGSAFLDVGNVFFDVEDFQPNKIASTTGLGLQFFTPIGPLRFEYGFQLQKQLDLAAGSYHLTLLYAF